MAHMIENGMVAYRGAAPWHGLGVAVTPDMNGAAMLEAAKMNWKVQRRGLAMRDKFGKALVSDPLKNFRAIVREDTDEVFQVATDRYFPMQNVQIVDFFKEYCEMGHAKLETVGALQGGRKVWALAKLNSGSSATLQGVDELEGYMLLATSHDGSLQTVGQATQVRVVCWNTLSAALGIGNGKRLQKQDGRFTMKHTTQWNKAKADQARVTMGMAIEQIAYSNEIAGKLANVALDETGRIEYVTRLLGGESLLEQIVAGPAVDVPQAGRAVLDAIVDDQIAAGTSEPRDVIGRLGKALIEAMMDSPGSDLVTAKNTMWGAVNGVSYYTDHVRGRSQDTRLSSAWFGQSDQLKNKAMQVAVEMAGLQMPQQGNGTWA